MNYTKVRRAGSNTNTLITSIPLGIVKSKGIKEGDVILWGLNRAGDIILKEDDLKDLPEV